MGKKTEKIYFTITGMNFYHGTSFLEPGMKVKIKKEPDNQYDKEAIKVKLEGIGKIGYVANSTRTVIGDSYSAGRLYDFIGKKAKGKVKYVVSGAAVCELITEI